MHTGQSAKVKHGGKGQVYGEFHEVKRSCMRKKLENHTDKPDYEFRRSMSRNRKRSFIWSQSDNISISVYLLRRLARIEYW